MGVRRHVPALELPLHLRRGLPRHPRRARRRSWSRAAAATAPTSSTTTTSPTSSRRSSGCGPTRCSSTPRPRAAGSCGPASPATTASPVTVTRLVDDACIFLNRPGFAGGAGCALHIAALEAGERPLDWKPNVCWQVPIRLEHATDENGHLTSRLREWKRRDWGEGGAEFHWWCTESPEAFVGAEPVYVTSRDEIVELVGQARLRHAGRAARAPRLGAAPPPGAAPTADVRRARRSHGSRTRSATERRSVVVVWSRRRRTRRRTSRPGRRSRRPRRPAWWWSSPPAAIPETEIERPRTRLLQLPRLFEAAMTTLLHAGLPGLVS